MSTAWQSHTGGGSCKIEAETGREGLQAVSSRTAVPQAAMIIRSVGSLSKINWTQSKGETHHLPAVLLQVGGKAQGGRGGALCSMGQSSICHFPAQQGCHREQLHARRAAPGARRMMLESRGCRGNSADKHQHSHDSANAPCYTMERRACKPEGTSTSTKM